jgi:prophage regulatory protein
MRVCSPAFAGFARQICRPHSSANTNSNYVGCQRVDKDSKTMQLVHTSAPVILRDRLLRLPDVEAITGCKKSTIYKLMKDGKFPRCVCITRRMSAWPETAVLQWVQDRINAGSEQ